MSLQLHGATLLTPAISRVFCLGIQNLAQTKVCLICEKELPFADFYKSIRGKYGLSSYCKKCQVKKQNAHLKELYATEEGKRKKREYAKKYYHANKDFREKLKKYAPEPLGHQ